MDGNDLCRRQPDKVLMDILSYAHFLRDGVGIKRVIVGQLLRRLRITKYIIFLD